jgi:hypothetical protein
VDGWIIECADSWPQDGDSEGAVVWILVVARDPTGGFGPSRLSASSNVIFCLRQAVAFVVFVV